jgi:hypothetical protein
MKKSTWKWWLLAVLALIMIYVWYDGLQMMSSESVPARIIAPAAKTQADRRTSTDIQYQPPRTNPFQQPTPKTAAVPSDQPRVPQPPPQIGSQYRITGILGRERQSQVVVTFGDSSLVLSEGDSLGTWRLLNISDRSAVFGQGKNRDTLWLYDK